MTIISSTVNLSPRIKLQSVQAVCTLPFIWGRLLSILSKPLLSVTVPQYTQGCVMYANISSAVKLHSSTRWYAFRKYVRVHAASVRTLTFLLFVIPFVLVLMHPNALFGGHDPFYVHYGILYIHMINPEGVISRGGNSLD
jgi:hypothetical protein